MFAYVIPSFEFEPQKKPEMIEVALMEVKKPEPPPPPPEPPKPEPQPLKPEPKLKQLPQPKPIPTPQVIKPSEEITPPPSVSSPPAVIAVAPKAEAPPTFTAPTPVTEPTPVEPTKPQVSDEDIENAKNRYGSALTREISKHKKYPKIAQMRGWQGEVLLTLHLDGNGRVTSSEVANSSGFESLDNEALAMVKKSSFPPPPEVLKGRAFEITVPVTFKLE